MSTTREAIVLPCTFLTVALLGGMRIGDTVRLVPPSLVALMLGMMLLGTLARAGTLAPDRLMNPGRTPMENVSGALVLATLFAASAQIFNLLTPEHGLLFVVFTLYFFIQLMTALAGVTDRASMLRSLSVLFAAAFALRFVVLESLYAAESGMMKRVLTTLLQGVSLGAIDYQPNASTTGYIGFAALVLFMIGLILLPSRARGGRGDVSGLQLRGAGHLVAGLFALCASVSACGGLTAHEQPPDHGAAGAEQRQRLVEQRDGALAAAHVWHPPAVPIATVDFTSNPADGVGGFLPSDDVSCRFVVRKLSGTTPKFHCELPDGRVVKVKYGASPELHAEVAATRLLGALGFGADRMYVVRSVRCTGCPRFPFQALQCSALTGLERLCVGNAAGAETARTFDPAVIENRMEGTTIEAEPDSGWSWFELDRIDPARGGSSRAEVDALRLLAVVLSHWDNKAPNQRLICPAGREGPGGACSEPLAMIQDLGATFGPLKLDLQNWRTTPVWADRKSCTVSMNTLPYAGATFPDRRISEPGRALLAGLLEQISERQLIDLFTASRVVQFDQVSADARDARAWARVFRQKVDEIREGAACPP
jgi:hypothetical protein